MFLQNDKIEKSTIKRNRNNVVFISLLMCLFISLSIRGVAKVKADDINQTTCSAESIEPTILLKSSDTMNEINTYDINFNGTQSILIVPMQVSVAGDVFIEIPHDRRNESLYITLYSDEECTKGIYGSDDLLLKENTSVSLYKINLPGTYYVKFELFRYEDYVDNLNYSISFSIMPTNIILESDISYLGLQTDGMPPQKHKIVIKEPGFIRVSVSWPSLYAKAVTCILSLKNEKLDPAPPCYDFAKNSLDKTKYYCSYYYKVNKGTFYLETELPVGQYDILYTFSSMADNGGSSLKKAPTIKIDDKPVNGKCTGTDKSGKSDWYKVKLQKSQNLQLTLVSFWGEDVHAQLCDSSGKPIVYYISYTNSRDDSCIITTQKKFKKGTYYIRIYKDTKKSYGDYSISAKSLG